MSKKEKERDPSPPFLAEAPALFKQEPTALAVAISDTVADLAAEEYDPEQTEAPSIPYIQLRQKPLMDERTGAALRAPGGFRLGRVTDLDHEDQEELFVTVLAQRVGRAYFQNLTDPAPICRSDDGKAGSRERDGDRFGYCVTCRYFQWGSGAGGRPACRENRKLMVMDWRTERPAILTLGPSSLRPWRAYNDKLRDDLAVYAKGGVLPFLHHCFTVRVRSRYVSDPAPHYVVSFEDTQPLPKDIQASMSQYRKEARVAFTRAVSAQVEEAEDYVGRDENGEG